MNILDALFNATIGGGIVGSALHLVTDWADRKNKIAIMEAQAKSAEASESWKAFTAAQSNSSALNIPANVPGWIAGVATLVWAIKEATRPFLTACAVVLVALTYLKSTVEVRATITPEILAASFGAIYFWFGSRYTRK